MLLVGCEAEAPACSRGGAQDGARCITTPTCGNGVLEGAEQCDDGNENDGDGCERDCTLPACGNHILDADEQCDDGNATDGDDCESNCTLPACGNGIVDAHEPCDDGNATDGDDCERNCTLPACGNHILDADEQCDDGNENDGDGCEDDCTTTPPPSDVDGDGAPDATDNCPALPNPDQADTDGDALGDACDACPQPNPGDSACPVTIYELKTPNQSGAYVYDGMQVTLSNQLVTAVAPDGFFIQVGEVERGDAGAENSGIFVETGTAPSVAAGDRVDIATAVPTSASGREELASVSGLSTVSTGNALPTPVAASAADLADDGARARALESVRVTIADATVTDTAPTPGSGDTSAPYEFVVDDSGLRIDDALYAISPAPMVNEVFASLTGIHELRYGHYRLEPTDAADVVFGPPIVVGFAPAFSYIDVGQFDAYTVPEPLTLTISRAQATDTFVPIDTSDPNALLVTGGGVTISAGDTSAPVKLSGIQTSPDVTLYTLAGSGPMADVRVIDRSFETPNLVELTPSSASAAPGGDTSFTVTLDMPAQVGGTAVSLSMNPASGFATFANPVIVPAGALSTSFDVTLDVAATGTAQLTASAGTGTLSAAVEAVFPP